MWEYRQFVFNLSFFEVIGLLLSGIHGLQTESESAVMDRALSLAPFTPCIGPELWISPRSEGVM